MQLSDARPRGLPRRASRRRDLGVRLEEWSSPRGHTELGAGPGGGARDGLGRQQGAVARRAGLRDALRAPAAAGKEVMRKGSGRSHTMRWMRLHIVALSIALSCTGVPAPASPPVR